MVKKVFVPHKEVIDVFSNQFYIPTIEKLLFYIVFGITLGSMECVNTRNDVFVKIHKNIYKFEERLYRKKQQNNW